MTTSTTVKFDTKLQHGCDWNGQDVTGWYLTEKMNGCRVYWDGEQLWSRGGKKIALPIGWTLPKSFPLDGELYAGIGGLSRCSVAVRYSRITSDMHLFIFDAPKATGPWSERMVAAARVLKDNTIARVLPYRLLASTDDALRELQLIQSRGGEGLILRHPDIQYAPGRTPDLLKMKYQINNAGQSEAA